MVHLRERLPSFYNLNGDGNHRGMEIRVCYLISMLHEDGRPILLAQQVPVVRENMNGTTSLRNTPRLGVLHSCLRNAFRLKCH